MDVVNPENINYYYLDGLEKKGPYNSEEIQARQLSLETLIFKDGSNSWLPLVNFPELQQPIKSIQSNEAPIESPENAVNNLEKEKIKISVLLIICLGFVISTAFGFTFTYFEKVNDLQNFRKEIDKIFNNKDAISDYSYNGTTGQLYKVFLSSPFKGGEKISIETKKHYLMSKPYLVASAKDYEIEQYNSLLKQWNDFKDLVEYYEADRFVGFTVLRLNKNNDRFSIENKWSGDMAYKVGEYKHYQGYSSDYYKSPGYNIPTNRPAVSVAYKEAAKFLTVENEDKSYEAGSYSKISSFSSKESNFYEIEQEYPRYSYYSDTIFVESKPNGQRSNVIDYSKISRNTSRSDGSIFNNYWIVWFKSYTNNYSIKEKNWILVKKGSIYSIALFAVFLGLFYILRYRKRIQIE
jgi:hypothetical protein